MVSFSDSAWRRLSRLLWGAVAAALGFVEGWAWWRRAGWGVGEREGGVGDGEAMVYEGRGF